MSSLDKYEKIVRLAKRVGIFWPSYEIYGGVSGFLDFGPIGSQLKRKIENRWREFFVKRFGLLEIDTPVASIGKVFEASGHLEHFTDKMASCERCGRKWRADHVAAEQTGECVDELGLAELEEFIRRRDVRCPECGGELGQLGLFNLMFETKIGPYAERRDFFRPETAQAMFTNFRRLYELARKKLPFGAAQIGRCLRNEISPRQGPIRLREFTIMEFEFFLDPEELSCPYLPEVEDDTLPLLPAAEKSKGRHEVIDVSVREALDKGYIMTEWQGFFMGISKRFVEGLGIPVEKQRFDEKMPWERAHYAAQTYDHEVWCERWGWIEMAGISYRTDYDLKHHMEVSGTDLRVTKGNRRFIPHVVEPSYGADRLLYAALEYAYTERDGRIILKLPREIAPVQVAVFPLVAKDGLPEKAIEVYEMLRDEGFDAYCDESGSIGKRYARADEIGVPIAITVDYQTLADDSVTLRDRDSWKQVRNKIPALPAVLRDFFAGKVNFDSLG